MQIVYRQGIKFVGSFLIGLKLANYFKFTKGVSIMPEDDDYKVFDTTALIVGVVIVIFAIVMAFVFR